MQNQGNYPNFQPPVQNQRNYPNFQPPVQNQGNYPNFQPPVQNQGNYPNFQPPVQNQGNYPNFQPPVQNQGNYPNFQPPVQNQGNYPNFQPPVQNQEMYPSFQPPVQQSHSGAVCFHHPTEAAVASCARCGKYICKDCAEAYGVISGDYAGKHLCFDCCEQLVAENIQELTTNKAKIKAQFILSIVGMSIGFIFGFATGIESNFFGALITGLICAGIGGVFLSALKAFASLSWEAIKIAFAGEFGILTFLSLIFQMTVITFKAIWTTITNTIFYINYLKKTSGFIEEDSAALQQMRDYMQYTLVRNQNKGVDLETLMNEGSELYNNSYAQSVRANGEEAADAALRQATTRIAENGEIIRDFPSAA